MRTVELTLLGLSVLAIIVIFVTEALRGHGHASAKLPAPMVLFIRITLGIIFAILGVVGSLLPVMQGWIFFLLAVLVLFPQSKFAIKSLDKIERRMPRLVARLRRWGIGIHRDHERNDETVRPRVL